MESTAILSSFDKYTTFSYGDKTLTFRTCDGLERYLKVLTWDHGYLEVLAKYRQKDQPIEEYIDLDDHNSFIETEKVDNLDEDIMYPGLFVLSDEEDGNYELMDGLEEQSKEEVAIVGPVPIRNLSNNTVLMRFYLVTEKQRLRKLFEYIQIISGRSTAGTKTLPPLVTSYIIR